MFLDYYHLREQPFGVTPDPRYLYFSGAHREALASLYYGVTAGRGFMALIAEPGMGKTTLLMQLLERLRKSACVAYLFQTQCNSRELVRYLLADMGLESREEDPVVLHERLKQALIRMSRAGRQFVLVIDEAQNLDDSVLEAVRLLSDFETPSSKLMQIILSGQPQLAEKLAGSPLVQLRQRIAILSRLQPFSPQETGQYIRHRLRIAGHAGGRLFTSEATALIAAKSRGIPRNINNLCFSALSLGCALRRSKIDREIVLEAAGDLEVRTPGPAGRPAQAEAPQVPAAKPHSRPRPRRRISIESGFIWSAALGAVFFLAFLLLFPSVRRDCRTSFPKAFAVTRLVAQPFQPVHPSVSLSVSTAPRAPHNALRDQDSVVLAPTRTPAVVVEVKREKTSYRNSVGYFWQIDKWLSQQILALYPQHTNPNDIEVGQRTMLSRRTRASTADHSEASAIVSRKPQQGTSHEP